MIASARQGHVDQTARSDAMCAGDDKTCPEFELHHRKFKETLDRERRSFLKSSFAAAGGAAALTAGGISLVTPEMAAAAERHQPARRAYHHLPANADTVHWGYFSKKLKPQVEINSGDFITIEALTHHANDDAERMVQGDPGAGSVYLWTKDKKGVNRRGAGPVDGPLKKGAGEGQGVHICTGPVFVREAEPGDILEVRIVDVRPRPSANPKYAGKAFGSNAAANWGFQYKDLITEPKPREVVTIYELDPGHISASSGWRRKKPTLSTAFRRAISAARWIIGASARGRRCTILLRFPARLCRSAIPMPRKAIPNSAARRTRRIIHDRSGISDTYLIERSRRARRDSWRN